MIRKLYLEKAVLTIKNLAKGNVKHHLVELLLCNLNHQSKIAPADAKTPYGDFSLACLLPSRFSAVAETLFNPHEQSRTRLSAETGTN